MSITDLAMPSCSVPYEIMKVVSRKKPPMPRKAASTLMIMRPQVLRKASARGAGAGPFFSASSIMARKTGDSSMRRRR